MSRVPRSMTLDLKCHKGRMSYAVPLSPFVRHVNDLWGCKCLSDLHIRGLFPNVKEITESNAAYMAVRRCLRHRFTLGDPAVTVVVVGDGHTPRTAALFAFRSAWQAVSIDPNLRPRQWQVKRLTCYPQRVEDVELRFDKAIVVGVHSHASLATTLRRITVADRAVVWIPCCVPVDIETPPCVDYVDLGIWSPQNRVMIWESI